jgi:uncharacterized protein
MNDPRSCHAKALLIARGQRNSSHCVESSDSNGGIDGRGWCPGFLRAYRKVIPCKDITLQTIVVLGCAIREPGNYYEILRAIARGATQFNEIVQQSKISSGQLLTGRLDRLAKLRYIEERRPLGGNGPAGWSVSDPFFRFWFRYVYPNRSRLQRGRVEEVSKAILADIDNHMGGVFEQTCRDWAGRYSNDERLAAADEIGAYWTRTHDVEVDLVARGRKSILAIGSCKWSTQANAHDLDRLIELRGQIRGAGTAALYVFARDFHKGLVERAKRDGVRLVSAHELLGESRSQVL